MATTSGPSNYREAVSEPRVVRVLDFDRLPRTVKTRLHRSLTGKFGLLPLAREARDEQLPFLKTRARCLVLGLVAMGVETHLWFDRLGNLFGPEPFQPLPYAALHGLTLGALSLSMLSAIHAHRLARATYLPTGKYLFAHDLLEVDGRRITVTSLSTMRSVELALDGEEPGLALHFKDGGWVRLGLGRDEDPQQIVEAARKDIQEARELVARDDIAKASEMDPLFEVRLANEWARYEAPERKGSGKRLSPRFISGLMLGFSLLVGAFLGPVVWSMRNESSDAAMFEEVRDTRDYVADTFDSYAAQYERVGRRHIDALDDVRYDRAKGNQKLLVGYQRWSQWREATTGRAGKHAGDVDDALLALTGKDRKAREAVHERYVKLHAQFSTRWSAHEEGMVFCTHLLNELDEREDPRVVLQMVVAAGDERAAVKLEPKRLEDLLGSKTRSVVKNALERAFGDDIEILDSSVAPDVPRIKVELRVVPPGEVQALGDRDGTMRAKAAIEFKIGVETSESRLPLTLDFTSTLSVDQVEDVAAAPNALDEYLRLTL